MQMRVDTIALADLGRLLDEGQIILAEVARAADAQAGGRTAQHDLIRTGHAGGFDARQGITLVELEDLLDVTWVIDVIIEHDVVAAIALEEPPILWNADRHRVHAQFADAIPVVERLFPAPVFIFAHHRTQLWPVPVQILDRFFLIPGRLCRGIESLPAQLAIGSLGCLILYLSTFRAGVPGGIANAAGPPGKSRASSRRCTSRPCRSI